MARVDQGLVLSVLVAAESAHAFSAFMPSAFTVRKFATDPADVDRIRSGYPPAIVFSLVLGGSVSVLTRDRRPILFSLVAAVGMIGLYESALRRRR